MFPGHMPISGNVSEWWRWKELKGPSWTGHQTGLAMKNPRPGASRTGYWLQYFFKCFLEILSHRLMLEEEWAGP
jgi:hypothetical protein